MNKHAHLTINVMHLLIALSSKDCYVNKTSLAPSQHLFLFVTLKVSHASNVSTWIRSNKKVKCHLLVKLILNIIFTRSPN